MDRLTCLISLFTASVCISVCNGQEVSPFTIAGDVRAPGNHFFEGWQQVQLADLLHRAHPLSESGNAIILRGQPLAVVTSINVQPNQQVRQTPLQPGDIVMFRRFEGGPTGDGTAVVAYGQVPTVVSLPGGPLPLFEVLESLQIQTNQPVSLVRAAWGELQVSLLNQNQLVQHGDVLDLPLSADGQQFVQIPVASESTGGFPKVLNHANLSRTVSQGDYENTTDSAIEMTEQSDVFQESAENSGMPSLIVPGLDFGGSTVNAEIAEDTTTFVSSPLTLPEPGSVPGSEIRDGEQRPDDVDAAFRNASLQRTAEFAESLAAGDRVSEPTAKTAASGVWNGIFVVGLLMAMALIVAGWIKTAQERRMEDQDHEGPPARNQTGQRFEAATTATSVNDNVPPTGMWQSDMFSEPITVHSQDVDSQLDVQPEVEAYEDRVMFAENEIEASEIAEILSAQDLQTASAIVEEDMSAQNSQVQAMEAPGPRTDHSVATLAAADAQEATAETAPDPLDDLIHNRLPLQLNQTQLPLQIALYGRPDGPRRLRIDAAHTQIAPPHMSSVERQAQRREPVMASNQKTSQRTSHSTSELTSRQGSRSAAQARYQADDPAVKTSSAGKPTAGDISRFDRALNFLEEQSER